MAGHEVSATDDGETALQYLQKSRPDILMLDLGLPNFDGLDILKFMRQAAQLREVKVVVITGKREMLRHPEVELADKLLLKPVDIREVLIEINKLAAFSA